MYLRTQYKPQAKFLRNRLLLYIKTHTANESGFSLSLNREESSTYWKPSVVMFAVVYIHLPDMEHSPIASIFPLIATTLHSNPGFCVKIISSKDKEKYSEKAYQIIQPSGKTYSIIIDINKPGLEKKQDQLLHRCCRYQWWDIMSPFCGLVRDLLNKSPTLEKLAKPISTRWRRTWISLSTDNSRYDKEY